MLEKYPSLKDLKGKKIPKLNWLIKEILPEGLCILGAKPKAKKSWFALNVGISVSTGTNLISNHEVTPGRVLYLSFEDSERRIKDRSMQICNYHKIELPRNFHYRTQFFQFGNGGKDDIKELLSLVPDFQMVIIDTLHCFIPFTGKNEYQEAYFKLMQISEIAKKNNVCIFFIHHSKKDTGSTEVSDDLLGSTGLSGVVDTLYIFRPRGRNTVLNIKGRDVEEQHLEMEFTETAGTWKIIGEVYEDETCLSELDQDIIKLLKKDNMPLGPTTIAEKLEKNLSTVKSAVGRLYNKGKLDNVGGKYVAI